MHPAPAKIANLAGRWFVLIAASALATSGLALAGVPAALLLGAMIAAMLCAACDFNLRIPRPAFAFSQGAIGCMIAASLPVSVADHVPDHWLPMLVCIAAMIAISAILSLLLTRTGVLPGTTVVWGLSPGAAAAMTILAEAYGADARLVAFMQYSRVLLIALIASVIAALTGADALHPPGGGTWFDPVEWPSFGATMALAISGPVIARITGLRAGALLIPVFAGLVLRYVGWITIELPSWLLAAAYAVVGWYVGLRFTRPLLIHALKALPAVAGATLALILACGLIALALTVFADIDPLTAYLATSPGGADTMAIIAASTKVDLAFVMTMQMLRLIVVLMVGPVIAQFVARRSGAKAI